MKKLLTMVGVSLALVISSCSSLTGSKLVSAEGLEKAKKLLEKDPYTGKAFTKVMLWAGQPLEENFESVTAQYFDEKQGKEQGNRHTAKLTAQQPFGHRVCVEADNVVANAVEMVASFAQKRGKQAVGPIEGHVGEGVVCADGVHNQPEAHKHIGQVAKSE